MCVRLKCVEIQNIENFSKLSEKMVLRREMYPEFLFFGLPQAPLNGIRFLCHDRVDFVNFLKKNQAIFKKSLQVFELSVRST